MGKAKRKTVLSPVQKQAKKIQKKYSKGYKTSPSKGCRTRKALFQVNEGISIRKAAEANNLSFGYLQRRASGELKVDDRKGPATVLSKEEENTIANYVSEMAKRGMGLCRTDVCDLVGNFLKKEKRTNPFKDGKPGRSWYYGFMSRYNYMLEIRKETPLEASRAKVTASKLDSWFEKYSVFLSDRDLLDKPHLIWNADETGFNLGSKSGTVIGPSKCTHTHAIPHLSGGSTKKGFTVMYCGSADGKLMPPFFIFPGKKPTQFDPLAGAQHGSRMEYTEKGWMDSPTFSKFIDHVDEHAGPTRPVLLLIDSVSSHVNMETFIKASSKRIEIYRLEPNSTHLTQPLDKGVFGPLKKAWHAVVKKNTREQPGVPIGKRTFARKLAEAHLSFFKPSTVVNSFKASGIYPVNRQAIPDEVLKPSLTFQQSAETVKPDQATEERDKPEGKEADATKLAFQVFSSVLTTPVREKYEQHISEGFDITGLSPGFDTYKTLKQMTGIKEYSKSDQIQSTSVELRESTESCRLNIVQSCESPSTSTQGLEVLAEVACRESVTPSSCSGSQDSQLSRISPNLQALVDLPTQSEKMKHAPKRLLDELPHCLTSTESIRIMALKKLKVAKEKAGREKKANARYLSMKASKKGKKIKDKKLKSLANPPTCTNPETVCQVCLGVFEQEVSEGISMLWVECSKCSTWMHKSCIPVNFEYNEEAFLPASSAEFVCHECRK